MKDEKTVIMQGTQDKEVSEEDKTVLMNQEPEPVAEVSNISVEQSTDNRSEPALAEEPTVLQPSHSASKARMHDEVKRPNLAQGVNTQPIGVGSVIRGRFELESELGEGGMGSVYRAIDRRKKEAEDDNPYVAIKLLSGDFKNHPKAFITLQRETKKTQALAHPNIITVFDFDREADVIYMTMEELRGQTLEDIILDNHGDSIERSLALKIIRGIASGLAYAHSKGIVHSDLKPGNIFVTEQQQVKILDFGIARVMDSESSRDRFDVAELGALTPSYASIEMIEHSLPSAKDDLYALGVIACELLGGAHPYKRKMATDARDQKLVPTLPKVGFLLKKVLLRAVVLESKGRTENCAKWLRQLEFAIGGYKKWLGTSIVVLVLAIANALYIGEVAEPQVALTDLTDVQQLSFNRLMQDAKTALEFGDINGALFSLDKAYQIHAENDQVEAFIASIIEYIDGAVEQDALSGDSLAEVMATLSAYRAFENERVQKQLRHLLSH